MADDRSTSNPKESVPEKHPLRVLVWDLPTRAFHWLLVLLVTVSFVTGKMGGTAMGYHEWSGVTILGLILFRVLWGFWGGIPSRFTSFVCGPGKVLAYGRALLGKGHEAYLGHNPMGAWSILAMLTVLGIQTGTGLFANDDIFTEGPLFHLVSKKTSDWLTAIHRINQDILMALVVLHLTAILFYWAVKRENLILPMITGRKHWHQAVRDADRHPARALVLAAILAAGVYWIIY
jgi:cytochrome b